MFRYCPYDDGFCNALTKVDDEADGLAEQLSWMEEAYIELKQENAKLKKEIEKLKKEV